MLSMTTTLIPSIFCNPFDDANGNCIDFLPYGKCFIQEATPWTNSVRTDIIKYNSNIHHAKLHKDLCIKITCLVSVKEKLYTSSKPIGNTLTPKDIDKPSLDKSLILILALLY